MNKEVRLLNVKIDNLNFNEALEKAKSFLHGMGQNYIVTPNPEILLEAKKDEHFRSILNLADMSIPDGIGLKLASLGEIKHRVTGADLMFALMEIAEKKDLRVYGIIHKGGFSTKEDIGAAIKQKYPQLKFELRYSGEGDSEEMIEQFKPDIIFIGLGAPKQEKWIAHHLRKFGYVKIFMAVGGSFDFLSGKTKRAPAWLRKSGLEWLWRLIRHPNRIGRIFNAVIVFPVKVIFSSIEK